MERLLPLIKAVLGTLWDRRFREALAKAKTMGKEAGAYRRGYSEGYWDGISDLAKILNQDEKELLQQVETSVTAMPTGWQREGVIAEA